MTLKSSVVIFQALNPLQPQWHQWPQQPQWPQWPQQPQCPWQSWQIFGFQWGRIKSKTIFLIGIAYWSNGQTIYLQKIFLLKKLPLVPQRDPYLKKLPWGTKGIFLKNLVRLFWPVRNVNRKMALLFILPLGNPEICKDPSIHGQDDLVLLICWKKDIINQNNNIIYIIQTLSQPNLLAYQ